MCYANEIATFACHLNVIKNSFSDTDRGLAEILVDKLHDLADQLNPAIYSKIDPATIPALSGADIMAGGD